MAVLLARLNVSFLNVGRTGGGGIDLEATTTTALQSLMVLLTLLFPHYNKSECLLQGFSEFRFKFYLGYDLKF